jgi:glycosyltransferase involved in cell wall biosynthesis
MGASQLKVIMVVPAPPHPAADTAAKWYLTLAQTLAERGHRVVCFAPYGRAADAHQSHAELDRANVDLRLFPLVVPPRARRLVAGLLTPDRLALPAPLREALRAELRAGYDVLHVEHIPAAWAGFGQARAVLSILQLGAIDLAGARIRSWRVLKERIQAARAERWAIQGYRHIRTLSPHLSAAVRARNPAAQIHQIPLALDIRRYAYAEIEPARPAYGMIGTMCWRPTREAAVRLLERVAPLVHATLPTVRLLVGGWDAKSWLRGCRLPPGAEISENLPDAEAFYRQLTCLVYPADLGSGMKVKVLEALVYGVPVVCSPVGLEGLDARAGEHLMVAESDAEIAAAVVRVLQDFELRRALRRKARTLMEEDYTPATVVPRIEAMYDVVMRAT